jgi:hypothetical protein
MPGVIFHLTAGSIMAFIGGFYFKNYFENNDKIKELILLISSCLFFSVLPDFVLIIYYLTHMSPFCTAIFYHNLIFLISAPLVILGFLILRYWINIKRKPILVMGLWCILLHIIMDLLIEESSIWF